MPANPKYLTKNPWQQFAKLSAGILGGYVISALLHMVLAIVFPWPKEFLITSMITVYILWIVLLIIPYLYKNGWHVWGVYLISIVLLFASYYFLKPYNPLV